MPGNPLTQPITLLRVEGGALLVLTLVLYAHLDAN